MRWELVFSFLLFFEFDDLSLLEDRSVLADDLLLLLTFLSQSSDSSSDLEEEVEDLVRSAFFVSSPLDFFDLLSPVVPVLLALALPTPLLVLLLDPFPPLPLPLPLPEPFAPLDDDDLLPPLPLPPCRASRMGI